MSTWPMKVLAQSEGSPLTRAIESMDAGELMPFLMPVMIVGIIVISSAVVNMFRAREVEESRRKLMDLLASGRVSPEQAERLMCAKPGMSIKGKTRDLVES